MNKGGIVEDGIAFDESENELGAVEITNPDIEMLATTISGGGISGEVEQIASGMVKAMELGLAFKTANKAALALITPDPKKISVRAVEATIDPVTHKTVRTRKKYIYMVTPKKLALGKVAMNSPADASGNYSVSYLALYIDGKRYIEIDPMNYVFYVNGVDYLKETRKALGK